MVAPAHFLPAEFWDEAERVGLVTMKSLVPQILARYAVAAEQEMGVFDSEPIAEPPPNRGQRFLSGVQGGK